MTRLKRPRQTQNHLQKPHLTRKVLLRAEATLLRVEVILPKMEAVLPMKNHPKKGRRPKGDHPKKLRLKKETLLTKAARSMKSAD